MNEKLNVISEKYIHNDRNNINLRILHILTASIICIVLYSIGIILWNNINLLEYRHLKLWINIYGWVGIIIYIHILYTSNVFTGKVFTPYTIFCLFILLFNYGQFIMWSLGIHYEGELGTTNFIRYMDNYTILKIEIISSTSILSFHIGALISMINSKKSNKEIIKFDIKNKKSIMKSLKIVCTFLLILSAPVVIYRSYIKLNIALTHGYTSLYYGDYNNVGSLEKYIGYFFFPSLIGYLISNKFSKKGFSIIGIIFGIYMIINLLSGDRGGWIFYLIILVWCYITYVDRINMKRLLKYILIGSSLLILTSVLVKFREIGFNKISTEDFKAIAQDIPYVFIKPLFEMGQSARVLGIIIQDNLSETWSYGSTYISAIASMFLPRIKTMLGYPDFYIDNWISQTHLGLKNYGVGFSITAEAYLNGGIIFFPIIMLILGFFIGLVVKCDLEKLSDPIKMFISLSSTGVLVTIAREGIELSLRKWAYGVLITLLLVYLLNGLINKDLKYNR